MPSETKSMSKPSHSNISRFSQTFCEAVVATKVRVKLGGMDGGGAVPPLATVLNFSII